MPLISLYRDVLKQADFSYCWHDALAQFLHTGAVEASALSSLFQQCQTLSIDSKANWCEKNLLLMLLLKLSKCDLGMGFLNPLIEQPWRWRSDRFAPLLAALANQDFIISEPDTKRLYSPLAASEMGVAAALIAVISKSEDLYNFTIQMGRDVLSKLDHNDFPFFSLWAPEGEGDASQALVWSALLFTICFELTHDEKWERTADRQIDHLRQRSDITYNELPLLPPLLLLLWRQQKQGLSFKCGTALSENVNSTACFISRKPSEGFAFTLNGNKSGLGAYHKNGVKVVSFGPWLGPLDEGGGYGVARNDPKKEIKPPLLCGWTRLAADDQWMRVEAERTSSSLKLCVHTLARAPKQSTSLAFLLQAKEAEIGGALFLPKTMRHYIGHTKRVAFYAKGDTIEITLDESRELELIPLPGKRYYWGADFLLAFKLDQSPFVCLIN